MRSNITLSEMKARCNELSKKYGEDQCCKHCDFRDCGCCEPPEAWKLDNDTPVDGENERTCQPNWEEMFEKADRAKQELHKKYEEIVADAHIKELENLKLRVIVRTIETVLGRKFDA